VVAGKGVVEVFGFFAVACLADEVEAAGGVQWPSVAAVFYSELCFSTRGEVW
jgi:hypothetical protein